MPARDLPNEEKGWFAASGVLVYAVLLAFVSRAHTLWRDEAEAWIVARDSHGLASLLHNVRYEGHPVGWYLVLDAFTRFTSNPEWMKVPNYLFAVAVAAMIFSAKQLSPLVRVGVVFSYFLLFEYAAIDRNYMMGILFLVGALMLMRSGKSVFGVPVMLSMAALTSLPALVVAVCFYPLHLLPVLCEGSDRSLSARLGSLGMKRWMAIALFSVCVLFAVGTIKPPKDSGLMLDSQPRTSLAVTLVHPFHDVAKAFVPVRTLRVNFWDVGGIDQKVPRLFLLFGFVLTTGLFFYFRQKAVRSFFIVAVVLLLMQMAVSRRTDARHVGWIFIVFVLALLLQEVPWFRYEAPEEASAFPWRSGLLYGVLAVQIFAATVAVVRSLSYSFSGSKAASDFLRAQKLDRAPMVFAPDYVSLPVLAYLERPSAYYVERHGLGSIVVWDKNEFYGRHMPSRAELQAASPDGSSPVLITEKPLTEEQERGLGVHRLALISGEIDPDNYFIYR